MTQPENRAMELSDTLLGYLQSGYMQREGDGEKNHRPYSKSSIHVRCVSFKITFPALVVSFLIT